MLPSSQLTMLERAMDASMLRQRVIANNIANVDTPHYKSKHVVFEELLQAEMQSSPSNFVAYRTDPRHFSFASQQSLAPRIVANTNTMVQNNGNNVDMEYEMNELAKNQIWYNGLVQITSGYFGKLRSVIEGGGK